MKNLSRCFVATLLLFVAIPAIRAQYVTIPNPGFVYWLTTHYPGCMSGNDLDTTCADIVNEDTVILTNPQITGSTYGIQFFDNLVYLDITGCAPGGTPFFSPYLPSSLKYFNCSSTDYDNSPYILPNGLTHLVMHGNSLDALPPLPDSLIYLDCSNNPLQTSAALNYIPQSIKYLLCRNTFVDSITILPPGLIVLDCYLASIKKLGTFPSTLQYLDVSRNVLSQNPLHVLPNGLKYLNCGSAGLSYIPNIPDSLTTLICTAIPLNVLPTLPPGIKYLDCSYTRISDIPLYTELDTLICTNDSIGTLPLFPNLKLLNCSYNPLQGLPALSAGLTSLSCKQCGLTSLPALPGSVRYLYCPYNALTSLPPLPVSLSYLNCTNNLLTSLPVLPAALKTLWCSNNPLPEVPVLPNGLRELYCSWDSITALPTLPDSLLVLECFRNKLNSLPQLPHGITKLNFAYNQVSVLPSIPATMLELGCDSNRLSALPELPDSLAALTVSDNHGLTCLPPLKIINQLLFRNTSVKCVPNYGIVGHSNPKLDTVPLCDMFNSMGCEMYGNISGYVFGDSNNNCQHDSAEEYKSNVKVQLWQNNTLKQTSFSKSSGLYSFGLSQPGNYTIVVDTTGMPFSILCPDSNAYHINVQSTDSFYYNHNIALICKPYYDAVITGVSPGFGRLSPANLTQVYACGGDYGDFWGLNCLNGISGTLTLVTSGPSHYAGPASAIQPTSVSGDTIVWSVQDLGATPFCSSFTVFMLTDTTATIGDEVCFFAKLTIAGNDVDTTNNSAFFCYRVAASFDPNDKQANPEGDMDTATKWIIYTVRFQNTGNAEAQHIHVDDTLDTNLDPASFQLLNYSHQPQIQLKENIIRFNFPNINLPDSFSNEPASHGFVCYKVKQQPALPIGTEIKNTAYIYFDYNPAVVTNTTNNVLTVPTTIYTIKSRVQQLSLWPNPATESINVKIPAGLTNSELVITDVLGRVVHRQQVANNVATLQVSTALFNTGVYLLSINSGPARYTGKFVLANR